MELVVAVSVENPSKHFKNQLTATVVHIFCPSTVRKDCRYRARDAKTRRKIEANFLPTVEQASGNKFILRLNEQRAHQALLLLLTKLYYKGLSSGHHTRVRFAHKPVLNYNSAPPTLRPVCKYATKSHCISTRKRVFFKRWLPFMYGIMKSLSSTYQ